jgi:hypothetical protein
MSVKNKSMQVLIRKVRRVLAQDPRWRVALDVLVDDMIKREIQRARNPRRGLRRASLTRSRTSRS